MSIRVRRSLLLLPLAFAIGVDSGCGFKIGAEQLKVEVGQGGMRLVQPKDGKVHAGEVVITITNATDRKRQFTLARTSARATAIPARLVEGLSYLDDGAIVAVSGVMRGAKLALAYGAIPQAVATTTKIHIYLHAHTTYLLFDRLGGYRSGLALRLETT